MITGAMYYMTLNPKTTVSEKVLQILKEHQVKYGRIPSVVEISYKVDEIKLPPNMNVVVRSIHLPNNHLMIGDDE